MSNANGSESVMVKNNSKRVSIRDTMSSKKSLLPVYGLEYLLLLLHLHGAITWIGEYGRSSCASRPATSDSRAPENQCHGYRNKDDTTKDASDDCRDLSRLVAVRFPHRPPELSLRGRHTRDGRLRSGWFRKRGHGRRFTGADLY